MEMKRHLFWLVLPVFVLAFTACGGGGMIADTLDSAVTTPVEDTAATDWSDLPGIPFETEEDALDRGVSTAPLGVGTDYILMYGGYEDGTDLILECYPDFDPDAGIDPPKDLSYAMYKVSGLEGMRPESLNIECLPAGLGEGYFVGIADYTTANWEFFGPVTFPEFELDLSGNDHQMVTNLGNMYFLIVVPPGNTVTHSQYSVVSGPADPGTHPGVPHHLIASDGQFPEKVHVEWLGGNGATEFEVFRRNAWGSNQEWGPIGTTTESHYVDLDVSDYKMYYYRVRSVNAAGESIWTNPDSGFAGGGDDPCVITGEITSIGGEKLEGIAVGMVGWDDLMVRYTNAEGRFHFGDLPPGEYIVAPHHPELTFFPEYQVVDLSETIHEDIHFNAAPTEVFHRVGGFAVTMVDGECGEHIAPLPGVAMVLHPVGDPESHVITYTNEHGFWYFEDLPEGIFVVYPVLEGFNFLPNMAEVIINGYNPPDRTDFLGVAVEGDDPPPEE